MGCDGSHFLIVKALAPRVKTPTVVCAFQLPNCLLMYKMFRSLGFWNTCIILVLVWFIYKMYVSPRYFELLKENTWLNSPVDSAYCVILNLKSIKQIWNWQNLYFTNCTQSPSMILWKSETNFFNPRYLVIIDLDYIFSTDVILSVMYTKESW